METTQKKKQIGIICVIAVVLLGILFIAFGKKQEYTLASHQLEKFASDVVTEESPLTGVFTPWQSHLSKLGFIFNREADADYGKITLNIYSEDGENIATDTIDMHGLSYGYVETFDLDVDLNVGEQYTYEILPSEYGELPISVDLITPSASTGEFLSVALGNNVVDHAVPLTESTYRIHLGKRAMLPYLLLLFLLGMVAVCVVEKPNHLSTRGKTTIYAFAFLSVSMLILMNDEGRQPLVYQGTEMEHSAGNEDYRGYLSVTQDDGFTGILAKAGTFMLDKGTYKLGLSYLSATNENTIEVFNDDQFVERFTIEPANTYDEYEFTLDRDMQRVEIRIYYSGSGLLKINEFQLIPETSFYKDNYFFLLFFVVLNIMGILIYRKHKKTPIPTEKLVDMSIVLAAGIFATLPFFNTNLVHADDICYHMLRIEGIKDAILDGQFPAVIMPNAMAGNGFLNSMYPYLFLYIPAVMRLFGVSLVFSYKFLIFLANIATAAGTYICVKSVSKSRYAAVLAGVLYVLLPYRYTNIYDRGALGELLAMTFLPFVLAGFYHLLKGEKKKWYYLVIGMGGVLQCHVLSFILVCILAVILCVIFWRDLFKDKRWIELEKAAAVTVLLSLWFVVPFIWFYLHEDLGTSVLVLGGYTQFSVDLSDFASTINAKEYYYLSFGIPVLVCFALGLLHVLFERAQDEERKDRDAFFIVLYVVAAILAIMTTGFAASENMRIVPMLQKFYDFLQFPWRLFAPASALILFVAPVWMSESNMLQKANLKMVMFALVIGISLLTGRVTQQKGSQYAYDDYDDTYTRGHEAKVHGILNLDATVLYPYEWRLHRMDDESLFTDLYPTAYENTEITSYEKDGTTTKLKYIVTGKEDATVIFPIMAYHGYHAYDDAGNELEIEKAHDYAVEVPLICDGTEHSVTVKYEIPGLFRLGSWISVLSVFGLVGIYCYQKIKKRNLNGAKS